MIEETVPPGLGDRRGGIGAGMKRAAGGGAGAGLGGADDDNAKRTRSAVDDEVVKVKMNTGTLYLYKGLNRRAVFVRRY